MPAPNSQPLNFNQSQKHHYLQTRYQTQFLQPFKILQLQYQIQHHLTLQLMYQIQYSHKILQYMYLIQYNHLPLQIR